MSTTLQTGVNNAGAAAVGTKIYLFGGDSANSTYKGIQVFDTTNNTIQTLSTTLPYYSRKVSAVTIGDKIYVVGGFGNNGETRAIVVFDISTNTIQKTINTNNAIYNTCIAAVGTKIYMFGGSQYADGSGTNSNTIRVFDTTNDTIQTLSTTLPEKKAASNAVTVGTKIYIFGGSTENSRGSIISVNTIQVFDTTNNTIQTLSTTLPVAAYFIAAAAVGTKIYLFGGQTGNGHFELKNINQFTVNVPLSSNDIIVTQEYYSRTFKVMKAPTEVEVACKYVYKGDQNLAKFIDAYLYDGANWVNVNTGDFTFTKLYAPKIRISNETLFITNDNRNGSKVTSYEIYKDGVLLTTTTNTSFDLSSLISEIGTYSIAVKAIGTNVEKSELSNEAKYIRVNMTYAANQVESNTSLTTSVNCQVGDLVVAAIIVRSALTLPEGWTLVSTSNVISGDTYNQTLSFAYKVSTSTSESITVTQATSGRIYTTLCALQGAKSVTDIGYTYSAANAAKHLTISKTAGIKLWAASSSLWITSAPYGDWTCSVNTNYIAVNQASYQPRLGVFYEPDDTEQEITFTMSSSESTSSIIVGGLNISYESEQYQITPTLTNVKAASGNATTIATGETKVLTYTAASGYTLPDSVTVTGATGVWNKDAGTLTLSNPTANVTFTIAGDEAATGYNVTVTADGSSSDFTVYDGQSSSGNLLGTFTNGQTADVICSSGYLYFYSSDYNGVQSTTGGVTKISDTLCSVSGDGTVNVNFYCLIEGTQITLADGTTKAIEDITYDDELLVWNFYAGRFDKAKPIWIKVAEVAPRYNLVKFSNGSEVGFVGAGGEKGYHRIFNKEAGKFTYTGNLKETPNGTTTFAQDGTFPTVVSQEIVEKEVKFYNVITDKHYNLFANGILTSCKLSNKYRIEDMKYVGEKLISEEEEKSIWEEKNKLRK